ncbi:MAG: M23 family metallopeptidase [Chlamydiales bacterium]|nr:M23 family metallopeptidase [Chlamydiales bacterium]
MKNSFWIPGSLSAAALFFLAACSNVPLNTPAVLILGPHQIVVQPGDTLYKIASQHRVSVKALMAINRLTSSYIQTGQVLLLPLGEKIPESFAASPSSSEETIEMTPLAPLTPPPYTPLESTSSNVPLDGSIDQEIAAEERPGENSGLKTASIGGVAGATANLPTGSNLTGSLSGSPSKNASNTEGKEIADLMEKSAVSSKPSSLTWPVQGNVLKNFIPRGDGKTPFDGIEIESPQGKSVVAAQKGKVFGCQKNFPSLGNLVIVKGSDETITAYGYLDKIAVKPNQAVTPGTILGTVGQKNKIYFEYRLKKTPIDPLKFLDGKAP